MQNLQRKKMIWKVIPSFPDLEASNTGKIRRCTNSINHRWGHGMGTRNKGYIYSTTTNKAGYKFIRFVVGAKRKQLLVNRLVCEAFHGKAPSNKPFALHNNGNKVCNLPDNLYWGTQKQNIEDRDCHGTTMRGDKHYFAKLRSSQIPKIRKLLAIGINQSVIARKYGVTNYTICDINRGKSWKHV